MAAEQLKEYEATLKQMMIWQGRGGLWQDWLAYQQEMRQSREAAEKEEKLKKAKRKERIVNICLGITLGACILSAIGLIGYIFYWVAQQR